MTDQIVKHYLVSICAKDKGYIHAYLMSDDSDDLPRTIYKMISFAERVGMDIVPVILVAVLRCEIDGVRDCEIDVVRDIVISLSSEASKLLKTNKHYHLSVFSTPSDHPYNEQLFEIYGKTDEANNG